MLKKQYNHVMFKIEKEADALTYYIEQLQNKYHLRTVYVAVNPEYWRLTMEGTNKAWKEFISSPNTKFTMDKSDLDGRFVFTMKSL